MAAEATNLIELYKEATEFTKRMMEGVQPQQRWDPTPCEDWNVQELVNHLVRGANGMSALLAGEEITPNHNDGDAEDFGIGVEKVLDLAKLPGILEKNFTTPRGEITGAFRFSQMFMDVLIHGWDLAEATGQDGTMPEELVKACFDTWETRLDKARESGGPFGVDIPVDANASFQERLLGLFGRKP